MNIGPMLNAYPDSMGGTLDDIATFLQKPEMKDVFSSCYVLPSLFHTDLDRGFSVIDYSLNKMLASREALDKLEGLGIDLKLDFILNHASVLSKQFQDIIKNGDKSEYRDFFIDWNKFWEGCGEMTEDGRILLHYRNEHLWSEDVAWVEAGVVQIQEENRQFLCNHITEGYILDSYQDEENWGEDNEESTGECLIPQEVFDNLQTDADASAVENEYVLGDWSQITKEALQGTWYYHPSDMGEDTSYDVILQLDGEDAIVYYPSVDFYGDVRYEWDIIDRSERGLCPELAIYWNGRDWGELAWYILGISENQEYFWCNGEVFYRQNH